MQAKRPGPLPELAIHICHKDGFLAMNIELELFSKKMKSSHLEGPFLTGY